MNIRTCSVVPPTDDADRRESLDSAMFSTARRADDQKI
jgi:hypothetical protein